MELNLFAVKFKKLNLDIYRKKGGCRFFFFNNKWGDPYSENLLMVFLICRPVFLIYMWCIHGGVSVYKGHELGFGLKNEKGTLRGAAGSNRIHMTLTLQGD